MDKVKRSNFYPDGKFIPVALPQDFRKAKGREACGNCVCTVIKGVGVIFILLLESMTTIFAINGVSDISKDNRTA